MLAIVGGGVTCVVILSLNFSGKPIYRVPSVGFVPGARLPGVDAEIPEGHRILIQRGVTLKDEHRLEFTIAAPSTIMIRYFALDRPLEYKIVQGSVDVSELRPVTPGSSMIIRHLDPGNYHLVLPGSGASCEVLLTAKPDSAAGQ